jgi:hypothetical protein
MVSALRVAISPALGTRAVQKRGQAALRFTHDDSGHHLGPVPVFGRGLNDHGAVSGPYVPQDFSFVHGSSPSMPRCLNLIQNK